MITPIRFEVRCVAYDCNPDRYPYAQVVTKPIIVDARSVREVGAKLRAAGWRRAPGRGNHGDWWCPQHARAAAVAAANHKNRQQQRAAGSRGAAVASHGRKVC